MLHFETSPQCSLRREALRQAASQSRVFMSRVATALLALIWCVAVSNTTVAQAPAPPTASSPISDPAVNSEKKYVFEWLVAGTGAAIVIYLVTRSAHRAEQPKEELDLILREPMH